MSNDRKQAIITVIFGIIIFTIFCICLNHITSSIKSRNNIHPLQQKVAVDSAKYIEVGKRMDNQIKERESKENTTIYNVTNIIQQGKVNKLYYSQSDSIKMFVADSLLKYGRYR